MVRSLSPPFALFSISASFTGAVVAIAIAIATEEEKREMMSRDRPFFL